MNNAFWEFSLAIYAKTGVANSCLWAQDKLALDVNVLLYTSWLASNDQSLDRPHLQALEAVVQPWREQVIQPLRQLRRQLRGYPQAATVVDSLQALELQTEQQQQDMMWAFFQRAKGLAVANCPLTQNLSLLVAGPAVDQPQWQELVNCLAMAIAD